ncbi:MAG: hypothetical protein VX893_11755 [Candidatus Latescibacterota bacterium]|nr:hypothetical protein [Candidatus Latescibacterota bacterium]
MLEESDGQLSLNIAGPGGIKAALNEASPLTERVDCSAASQARCRSLEVAALGQAGAAVAIVLLEVCDLPLLLVVLSLGGVAMSVERRRRGCALG